MTNCNDDSLITTLTGHTGGVTYLIIDDGKLYSGDHDGTIKIWNCSTYQFITNLGESSGDSGDEYEGHTSFVACLTINDGKLYSGSWDKTIKVWDCSTNKLITTLGEPDDPIQHLTFQNGKLYAQDWVGDIYIWQL